MLFSAIIPARNAENTIEKAVLSLADQLEDIEIIVVENGSTDATVEIINQLLERVDSLKLVHSEPGVSNARNKGLDLATGEWILFVDADDYLVENIAMELTQNASDASVDFWLYSFYAGKELRRVAQDHSLDVYGNGHEIEARVRMLENPTLYMTVWSKLFNNDIIQRHHLRFQAELSLSEDSDFTFRYSKYCRKIVFSPLPLYHYVLDANSTMRSFDGAKTQRYLFAMNEIKKKATEENVAIRHALQKYILIHFNIAMVREVFEINNAKTFSEKKREMREVAAEPVFREALEEIKITECLSLRMAPFILLKWGLYSLCGRLYQLRVAQNKKRTEK